MNKSRKIVIYTGALVILALLFVYSFTSKSTYTNLQTKYLEICENYNSQALDSQKLEDIVQMNLSEIKASKTQEDSNVYTFEINDEQLVILTHGSNDTLEFIQYNKFGDIELAYSVNEGTDIGGFKPGFTSKFNSKDFDNQKKQLDNYNSNK